MTPWGEITETGSGALTDFAFTGHLFDRPTGLSLTLYRGYDPNLGRWLSKDPIGLRGGLNLYGYVNDDPLNGIDPDGLMRDPSLPLPLGPLLCMKFTPAGSKAREYCCKKTCEEAFEGWGQAVLDCRAACDRKPDEPNQCPAK